MKIRSKLLFWIGVSILLILGLLTLISVPVESGSNYNVTAPLLGLVIFYNPIVLMIYIIAALILIFLGFKKIKFV